MTYIAIRQDARGAWNMRRLKTMGEWLYWTLSVTAAVWVLAVVNRRENPGRDLSLLWQWTDDPVLQAVIIGVVAIIGIALMPGILLVMWYAFVASLALAAAALVIYLLYALATLSATGTLVAALIATGLIIWLLRWTGILPRARSSIQSSSDYETSVDTHLATAEAAAPDAGVSRRHNSCSDRAANVDNLFNDERECPDCNAPHLLIPSLGNGECGRCHGTGFEPNPLDEFVMTISGISPACKMCGGTKVCQRCNGRGYLRS